MSIEVGKNYDADDLGWWLINVHEGDETPTKDDWLNLARWAERKAAENENRQANN